jgi:hypothetical protein
MKIGRLKIPEEFKIDVEKIKNVFASYGILLPDPDIMLAWGIYSETKGEEWCNIPEKSEDVYLALIDYFVMAEW